MKLRALLVTVILSLSISAAASLTLHSDAAPYAMTDARCVKDAHLVVSQETFTFELPAECAGKPAEIRVKSGNIERIETIAAVSADNTVDFSPQLANIDKIFLSVGTWPVAISWEYDVGPLNWIECIGDCYITDIEIRHVTTDNPPYYQLHGVINTDAPGGVVWELRLNASDDHLPFVADRMHTAIHGVVADPVNCGADPRIVRIRGSEEWIAVVHPDEPRTFQLLGSKTRDEKNLYDCSGN